MKCFIVLSALVAVAMAKPGYLLEPSHYVSQVVPLAYAKLVPGAPIGHDGKVVDTLEVRQAKAEHDAAHINERIALAQESVKSADLLTYAAAPAPVATAYYANSYASLPVAVSSYQAVAPAVAYTKYVPAAPLGYDRNVVDTAEVRQAKAEHAVAHFNEKIAHVAAKSSSYVAPQVQLVSAYSVGSYAPHYVSAQPW